jgi:hypothetical protein
MLEAAFARRVAAPEAWYPAGGAETRGKLVLAGRAISIILCFLSKTVDQIE